VAGSEGSGWWWAELSKVGVDIVTVLLTGVISELHDLWSSLAAYNDQRALRTYQEEVGLR